MNIRLTVCAVAISAVTALPALASTFDYTDHYSSFWSLGDSLTGGVPSPVSPGEEVRFTDGLFWSERIIQDFDPDPTAPEPGDKPAGNFALVGATAGGTSALDLTAQTQRLIATDDAFDVFGPDPLVAIWIGANDVGAIAAGADFSLTTTAYSQTLQALYAQGVRDFLLFEVPAVGESARFADTPLSAPLNGISDQINTAFFDGIVAGLASDVEVTIIGTFSLTEATRTTPEFFGGTTSSPCRTLNRMTFLFEPTATPDCTATTYYDDFHPTSLVHEFVANEVREALTPIPLPAAGWLLLAGIGGLAALRRRKT